ncbi:unnamed protein product, partial [Amoebophrya sp. A25]
DGNNSTAAGASYSPFGACASSTTSQNFTSGEVVNNSTAGTTSSWLRSFLHMNTDQEARDRVTFQDMLIPRDNEPLERLAELDGLNRRYQGYFFHGTFTEFTDNLAAPRDSETIRRMERIVSLAEKIYKSKDVLSQGRDRRGIDSTNPHWRQHLRRRLVFDRIRKKEIIAETRYDRRDPDHIAHEKFSEGRSSPMVQIRPRGLFFEKGAASRIRDILTLGLQHDNGGLIRTRHGRMYGD